MKNQVTIVANSKTGKVVQMKTITDSKTGETREVGSVMLQSSTITGLGRLARASVRTCFLTLEQSALDLMQDYLVDGAEFPFDGRIRVVETLKPYVRKNGKPQDPKINPTSKKVITYQGKPVYRNTEFSETNEPDVFLKDPVVDSSNEATE